jgi:hypothetical protein
MMKDLRMFLQNEVFTLKQFEKQTLVKHVKILPQCSSRVLFLFFLHGSFPSLCWLVVDILRFFF